MDPAGDTGSAASPRDAFDGVNRKHYFQGVMHQSAGDPEGAWVSPDPIWELMSRPDAQLPGLLRAGTQVVAFSKQERV